MGIIDDVTRMKNQGMQESEIIGSMQQQGFSPKAVQDALSQSQIKNAISSGNPSGMDSSMQPSIMPSEEMEMQNPPTPQQYQSQDMYEPASYDMGQEPYQPDMYSGGGEYQDSGFGSETIIEIAEQVFSDKIKKSQNIINDLNEFKTITETKVDAIDERLKKIEKIIDKLQISILEKVGSFGANVNAIKNELSMMQDSFGKVINPLTDKSHHKPAEEKKKTTSKKKSE